MRIFSLIAIPLRWEKPLLREMRFFKNSAAKVVFMYATALVSEKRDAQAESLFFVPFWRILFANWPIFRRSVLGCLLNDTQGAQIN